MKIFRQKKEPVSTCLNLWRIASLLFAAIVAVLVAGFFPLSHPLFTRYAHSIINKIDLDTCNVGKVKVAFWKGVTVYDVHVSESEENGLKYELSLSRIRINCNVINVIQKWAQIKKKYRLLQQFSQIQKTAMS